MPSAPFGSLMSSGLTTMPATVISPQQRAAAPIAGVSCLLAMIVVVVANYVLLNPLIVRGNAADTARNILAHQTQFRAVVVGFLAYGVSVVVLVAALYVILRPVHQLLALVGALFRLLFALLWLLATLNLLGALRLIGSASYLQVIEPNRLQALARTYLAGTFDDYYVGLPFFALAATVSSYLWLRSRYIPRPLAWFGLIGSGWCVFCAFAYLVFPGFAKPVNPYWFDSPMALFELATSVWLLVKGLGSQKSPGTDPNESSQ
ncbi:MAG: DUF4386 domain-containing protein [Chthoniobacterales bacterium]